MKKLCTFEGYFKGGVNNVSFSSSRRLAVSTIDDFNEIFIFDILTQSPKGGILVSTIKTGIVPITQIAWNHQPSKEDREFAIIGMKMFKIWNVDNSTITLDKDAIPLLKGGS